MLSMSEHQISSKMAGKMDDKKNSQKFRPKKKKIQAWEIARKIRSVLKPIRGPGPRF